MGRVGFEARFRVLLRFQRFRAWLEFEARVRVLLRFWRFGTWLNFDVKNGGGYLIVVRIEECHD